jgi:hypothetical protein
MFCILKTTNFFLQKQQLERNRRSNLEQYIHEYRVQPHSAHQSKQVETAVPKPYPFQNEACIHLLW